MKPDADVMLGGFAGTLLMDIAPQLGGEYTLGSVGIISMSMLMMAQEVDRAAEIRYQENAQLRALFAEAARIVDDKDLAKRLDAASATKDESLRVRALDASNDALKKLLIELQALAEVSKAPWAAGLESKIWDFLLGSVEARRFVFPALG
ncbi:hypothetical protein F2P47_14550 [Parvibaculum sedimenti]|uniref:Uncharacterized protein n=1 Tax=Parvibaculum sedimenti TaxID=2608632 RepID=A0A6N6VEA3_9HYPH|nr:hypothetical protein [Parvibaculum sedimenti]KAB7739014.1 hypothetical protein F2P47_14550 [Parvibaculum sedimenti]